MLIGRVIVYADVAQLVEHHLAKVRVASSNLVVRSAKRKNLMSNVKKSLVLFFLFTFQSIVLFGCSSNTDLADSVESLKSIDNDKLLALLSDKSPIPLDSEISSGTLENGITYFALSNENPGLNFEARLVVKAGGLVQVPVDSGIAHFVEHMVFQGTQNFPNGIFDGLEGYGINVGTHINGWTSCDATTYAFRATSRENLEMVLKALDDIATLATFPEDRIEVEKNIILEEARPDESIDGIKHELFREMYTEGTLYEECNTIGTSEGIRNVTSQDLIEYYDLWYRPDLMAVILVGDLPTEELETKIIDHFADNPEKSGPGSIRTQTPNPYGEMKIRTFTHSEVENIVSIDFSAPFASQGTSGSEYEKFLLNLVFDLAHEHMLTRAEYGDITFSKPWGYVWSEDFNLRFFGWGFDSDNPAEELKELLKEVRFLKETGFSEGLLEKELAELTNALNDGLGASAGRQDGSYADDLVTHFINGVPVADPQFLTETWLSWVDEVTLEDVNSYFVRLMNETAPQVFILGKREAETPNIKDLEKAILDSATESLDGIENAVVVPLFDNLMVTPEKSRESVNRISHDDFWEQEVVELNFSNGSTAIHTYSDITPEKVNVLACSPGSYSELQSGDSALVNFATSAIDQSGVGNLSSQIVNNFLETNRILLISVITPNSECQLGATSPESLFGLMELIHLRLTTPRVDEQVFAQELINLDSYMEDENDPYVASSNKISEVTYGEDLRRMFPTSEQIETFTPQKALQIYEEVFTGAEGLTVVFVGDVTLDQVEELSRTYIATLPTGALSTGWEPQPYLPSGVVTENVTAGLNQALSGFDIQFQNELPRGERDEREVLAGVLQVEVQGMILQKILENRLFERLRDELGISYNAAVVSISYELKPDIRFFVDISVDTSMETVELAHEVVLEEIELLRTTNLQEKEFSIAKETILNELSYVSNEVLLMDLIDWKLFTTLDWPFISYYGRLYFAETAETESISSVSSLLMPEEHRIEIFRDQPPPSENVE